ncbi:MAG TPA: TIGR03960 family B12-binding radical SAM protein [Candidatus Obscuribacterales bacterium]
MLAHAASEDISRALDQLLDHVLKPGQYIGNEWGARRKSFREAQVRLALAFPDLYELGMSNFGLKILYQIVNDHAGFMCDRSYAPQDDMEALLRSNCVPLWGWESREPLRHFDLLGFSLQYELTYTNVLNMLDLAGLNVRREERSALFPLVFGGGPSSVNPEPMAPFMDFFLIGDGEQSLIQVMQLLNAFKDELENKGESDHLPEEALKAELLQRMAETVPGVYVPSLYKEVAGSAKVVPIAERIPERVLRQVVPLSDQNQPTKSIVPYLALVHDREVLEVRRGCDRGCRFCQPGYTFLPVRERSTDDLLRLSKEALAHSGNDEYSLLSLCVSDYTSLHDSVRALNAEHSQRRSSLSFPSQRADRMNLDIAEELKVVRKSGITLAPEAGSERLRQVINKGLSHNQIISAIEAAYRSGWTAVKLYFMCGLPTERDEDLKGIIDILKEATAHCRAIRKAEPAAYRRGIEFTCTISNFVPKPFTPFQWYGQITRAETSRRHQVLKQCLKESGLKNVTLNLTDPEISLLEAVISRGDRQIGELIYAVWKDGAVFDAWDDKFKPELWHRAAKRMGLDLESLASFDRQVGSEQPWDIVHIGLQDWWLVKEWEKAMQSLETAPCTENLCHACGVCTELTTTHLLSQPKAQVLKRNPFVKELAANDDGDHHPSLFFTKPPQTKESQSQQIIRFEFHKIGELRYISHLDLQNLLARAARRAMIPIAYSQGFNPSPRLILAQPLPLFQEGTAEVGQVELSSFLEEARFIELINAKLPPEVQITRARTAAKTSASLASHVESAHYTAQIKSFNGSSLSPRQKEGETVSYEGVNSPGAGGKDWLSQKIEALNNASTLPVPLPDGKCKDIRPGVFSLTVLNEPRATLKFELATGPNLHVKPGELLALVAENATWKVTRTQINAKGGVSLYEV